jgi:hypothetical protein
MHRRSCGRPAGQFVSSFGVRVVDRIEHRASLAFRHARPAAQPFGRPGKRGSPAQMDGLGMNGVTQVRLQRHTSIGCCRPDLFQVGGWHIANENVRHRMMLSS